MLSPRAPRPFHRDPSPPLPQRSLRAPGRPSSAWPEARQLSRWPRSRGAWSEDLNLPLKLVFPCTSHLPRVAALFVSCDRCDYAMRPPARGRAPAQDTSRALPTARQTDTSHNSIQQASSSACVSGLSCRTPTSCLAIPHAGATRASRAEPDGRSSAIQDTPILMYRSTREPAFCPDFETKTVFCFLSFSLFFPLSLSCMRCGPRRGGALLPRTQAAPLPRRGRQTLAITQFSKASSACVSGLPT